VRFVFDVGCSGRTGDNSFSYKAAPRPSMNSNITVVDSATSSGLDDTELAGMARFLKILGLGTSGEEGDLGESLDVNRISEQPVVMKDKVLNQNPQASEGTLGPPSQSDAYVDDVLRNSQDLEILMGCCQTFMARFEEAGAEEDLERVIGATRAVLRLTEEQGVTDEIRHSAKKCHHFIQVAWPESRR